MAVYTLSLNFFNHLCDKESIIYFYNILSVFANDKNRHKIAIDKDGLILDRYRKVDKNRDLILFWVSSLADRQPTSKFFEQTNADISSFDNDEIMCLEICRATQGQKKLIVYSRSSCRIISVNPNDEFVYRDVIIHILDKDDASDELALQPEQKNIIIKNSQVAGGDINNSQNN